MRYADLAALMRLKGPMHSGISSKMSLAHVAGAGRLSLAYIKDARKVQLA